MIRYREFEKDFDARFGDIYAHAFHLNRAMMSVRKDETGLDNLRKIIHATLQISNRRGFHAMTLRELSRAAEISMGALYYYIPGKDSLVELIVSSVSAAVRAGLGAPPADLAGPRQRLEWLLRAHVYLTEILHPWFFFMFMEAKAFEKPARDTALEHELYTEGLVQALIEAGAADGSFSVADPRMAAALVKPMLQDWYVKRRKHRARGLGPDDYADAVVAFVLRALAPAA